MPPLRVGNTADWNLKARARTHWRRTTNGIGSVPREAHKEMRTLTMEQVATMLLPAIREHPLYPAIFLAFGTGLRRGELLALRWQDIDLDAGTVTVKQTLVRTTIHEVGGQARKTQLVFQEPKTPQSRRTVPLPEACLVALRHHEARQAEEKLLPGQAYENYGLVFSQLNGRPIDPRNFIRTFEKIFRQAGLPPIRFHDARHTFATLMMELGESPKTVQTLLGHSRVAITLDIYSHVSMELEKKAAAKLNAALSGIKKSGLL